MEAAAHPRLSGGAGAAQGGIPIAPRRYTAALIIDYTMMRQERGKKRATFWCVRPRPSVLAWPLRSGPSALARLPWPGPPSLPGDQPSTAFPAARLPTRRIPVSPPCMSRGTLLYFFQCFSNVWLHFIVLFIVFFFLMSGSTLLYFSLFFLMSCSKL